MYQYYEDVKNIFDEILNKLDSIQDSSKSFYERHGLKFFKEYMSLIENEKRPLNAITYFDINTYLHALPFSDDHKANVYNSLKKFFDFTYSTGKTPDTMSKVVKPDIKPKKRRVISEDDYFKIKDFIVNNENSMNERLTLGLFLFTGLSRQYIANMRNSQIIFENGIYKLSFIKTGKKGETEKYVIIPIKIELQLVINEYFLGVNESKMNERVLHIEENYTSTYVSSLSEKITGKKYSPTVFSNTFIKKALKDGNNVLEVSGLILESVSNVAKIIDDDSEELFRRQTVILNSF